LGISYSGLSGLRHLVNFIANIGIFFPGFVWCSLKNLATRVMVLFSCPCLPTRWLKPKLPAKPGNQSLSHGKVYSGHFLVVEIPQKWECTPFVHQKRRGVGGFWISFVENWSRKSPT
jgi:hypothetical protein